MKASRLITTTILGAVFGVICMFLSRYTAEVDFWPIGVAFLLHHTVLGFTIGASSLKMHWAAHGAFWGALFGVFLAIIGVDIYPDPWQLFVIPVIWGFLIETLATKAFKQPQPR
ncbi:MAG: hypothetical protein MUO17_03340 [Dehalococcoidales bacterium]|jgi:hypothetical protein|nr:hypothetical protein [Dehalococcoidales bacterium]